MPDFIERAKHLFGRALGRLQRSLPGDAFHPNAGVVEQAYSAREKWGIGDRPEIASPSEITPPQQVLHDLQNALADENRKNPIRVVVRPSDASADFHRSQLLVPGGLSGLSPETVELLLATEHETEMLALLLGVDFTWPEFNRAYDDQTIWLPGFINTDDFIGDDAEGEQYDSDSRSVLIGWERPPISISWGEDLARFQQLSHAGKCALITMGAISSRFDWPEHRIRDNLRPFRFSLGVSASSSIGDVAGPTDQDIIDELQAAGFMSAPLSPRTKLDRLLIPQLKEILRSRGLKVGGRKQELLDRVKAVFTDEEIYAVLPKEEQKAWYTVGCVLGSRDAIARAAILAKTIWSFKRSQRQLEQITDINNGRETDDYWKLRVVSNKDDLRCKHCARHHRKTVLRKLSTLPPYHPGCRCFVQPES